MAPFDPGRQRPRAGLVEQGTAPSLKRELALLMLLASLWGLSFSWIKVAVRTIPPITAICARTLLASSCLLLVMRARQVRFPRDRATLSLLVVQACLNSAVPFVLVAWGEEHVSAALATILGSMSPIFAALITGTVTRHENLSVRKCAAVAGGLVGVALIVGKDALSGLHANVAAELAIVAASCCYGSAAVFGARFKSHDPLVPATGSLAAGALILFPFSLAIDRPWTLHPSVDSLVALAGLAILSTALTFLLYFRLIATLGTLGASAQAYLRVPVGVGLAMLWFGDRLPAGAWIGMALVIVSVAGMTARKLPLPFEASRPA